MTLSYNTVAMLAFRGHSDASEAIDLYYKYRGEVDLITSNGVIGVYFYTKNNLVATERCNHESF